MDKTNPHIAPPHKRYVDFDSNGDPLVYGRPVSRETFTAFINYNLDALEQISGNLAVILEKGDFINDKKNIRSGSAGKNKN